MENKTAVVGCCAFAAGAAAAALYVRSRRSDVITRWGVTPRAAGAVSHGGVVYLSGQVGDLAPEVLESSDVAAQTRQTLAKIDKALAEAGTSKRHILRTEIWLKDIARDFGAMNEVFYEWVGEFPDQKGVRACVEANMARPKLLVEIMVIAAVPPS
jgi:enamine deaminase RidA (YjgF/YER057c/UK114 family)